MHEQTDTELVKQFQRGDGRAFATFAERHRDRLYRLATVWIKDRASAEDAVQEAFARSYTGLMQFRFRAAPSTWLIGVCRNICLEMNRQSARTEGLDEEALLGQIAPEDATRGQAHASLSRPLRVALESLPPRQRDVVLLRLFEDCSVKETAAVLRCREGTVKAHLAKAIANLRQRVEGIEDLHHEL